MKPIKSFIALSAILCVSTLYAERFYDSAFSEIVNMLEGDKSLSIKQATYVSELAYLQGNLKYDVFNGEILRIASFLHDFIQINQLERFHTGKQMAICEYFFKPWSGNNYIPYTYDFGDDYPDYDWHYMLVSRVLDTHKGRCRSLPWTMMIIAEELDAEMYLAYAPKHVYMMYPNLDNHYPEEWVNVEVTTHQFVPAFWIQEYFKIPDSALTAGTYMTPLTKQQVIARQLADLAFSYWQQTGKYDSFTYKCADISLRYYPMNPNAILIKMNSAKALLVQHLEKTNYQGDCLADSLNHAYMTCEKQLQQTHFVIPDDNKYITYK